MPNKRPERKKGKYLRRKNDLWNAQTTKMTTNKTEKINDYLGSSKKTLTQIQNEQSLGGVAETDAKKTRIAMCLYCAT